MPRIRLIIRGIATLDEARLAVAAGAEGVVLDPSLFPALGMAGNELLAEIALALPPAVTPILLTNALTAGTIAQQVDAAAATAVQIMRPLPASEHPGLKRIIRGRKIIQSIDVSEPGAMELAESYAEFADALHLDPAGPAQLPHCRQIAEAGGLPMFVRASVPEQVPEIVRALHPFAIELDMPRRDGGIDEDGLGRLSEICLGA